MEKVIEPVLPRRSAETVLEAHRKVTLAAALFALYITLDWLTYVFPARFGVTPFNPEAAVAMAMLMFCGLRTAPLVFLAVLFGEYVVISIFGMGMRFNFYQPGGDHHE